jgi:ubiquinone/menaquinone biosynthesis C-methylase UbiE
MVFVMDEKKIKAHVKTRYGKIAKQEENLCSCCGGEDNLQQAQQIGYTKEELEKLPEDTIMGLGCGNPTALAELKNGEIVLDLGSGAGIDVFLASQMVGAEGKVIGLDMTPEMIQKAQENALKGGYTNIEFILGEIETIPLDDNIIDIIISNCVINLTTDKLKAFQEAYRVLKPGGRLLISDLVTLGEIKPSIRENFEAWSNCIAGAMDKDEYLKTIEKAGFSEVNIKSSSFYSEPNLNQLLEGKIVSINVEAIKN